MRIEFYTDNKNKIFLILLIFICFLFFIDKPLFIDENLFVETGEKISQKGWKCYNFYGNFKQGLVCQSNQNPPLTSYVVAIASLFSPSIVLYRFVFIIPAILLIFGIYKICRIIGFNREDSFYTSIFSLATPVYMLLFIYIMSDILMTMFYVWAVYFWIKGENEKTYRYFYISAILICFCFFTKYFGITAVPLLFVFSIIKNNNKLKKQIVILFIPIIFVIIYELFTLYLYGIGLTFKAILYPNNFNDDWRRFLFGLSFFAGCYLWIILELNLISVLIAASLVYFIPINDIFHVELSLWCKLQMVFLISIGISGVTFLLKKIIENNNFYDPYIILFVLWIGGTWIFSTYINWSINARTMLPMIAPTSILFYRFSIQHRKTNRKVLTIIIFFIFSFLIQCADYEFAMGQKKAVVHISKIYDVDHYTFWSQGWFGFSRLTKDILNAKPVDFKNLPVFNEKVIMVIPKNNCNIRWPVPKKQYNITKISINLITPIGIMNRYTGAGIHHYKWRPLPFAIGPQPPNEYYLYTSKLYFESK